jgi:predicted transcriptional regulator
MTETARRIETDVTHGVALDERPERMAAESVRRAGIAPAGTNGAARAPRMLPNLAALRADPRLAIAEDSIRCLICGQSFRQLTNTHLRAHDMSAIEYKQRFGYNRGRPLMCRVLQRLYADRAVKTGLASQIRSRPILVEPKLRRLGGSRTIALEELLTRRDARRRAPAPTGQHS